MDNTQAMKLIGYLHADNEKMRRLLEAFENYFSAFYAVKNDDTDPYDLLDEWDEMKDEPTPYLCDYLETHAISAHELRAAEAKVAGETKAPQ